MSLKSLVLYLLLTACIFEVVVGEEPSSSSVLSSSFVSPSEKHSTSTSSIHKDNNIGYIMLVLFLILLLIAFGCLMFYLWRSGKLVILTQRLRSGPRSATVRYSSLTGDSDWLEDDDDDMLGGDVVSGVAPVVVVQDAPSNPSASKPASSTASAASVTKDTTSGAWEIRWDEDLDDDGGIGAWGTLPVTKPTESSAKPQQPTGSNPFDDDDAF